MACWWRLQPFDLIRDYFGEKIVFYFAWLSFYTLMLFPAALVGVGTVLYGVWTLPTNQPTQDICVNATTSEIEMCPRVSFFLCNSCFCFYDLFFYKEFE